MEHLLEGVIAGVVDRVWLVPSEACEEEQFRDGEVLDFGRIDRLVSTVDSCFGFFDAEECELSVGVGLEQTRAKRDPWSRAHAGSARQRSLPAQH